MRYFYEATRFRSTNQTGLILVLYNSRVCSLLYCLNVNRLFTSVTWEAPQQQAQNVTAVKYLGGFIPRLFRCIITIHEIHKCFAGKATYVTTVELTKTTFCSLKPGNTQQNGFDSLKWEVTLRTKLHFWDFLFVRSELRSHVYRYRRLETLNPFYTDVIFTCKMSGCIWL